MVKGDKARADEIMETGLDAGRDDGRDPDRDRDIVWLVLIHTKSKPREQESSFLSDVYSTITHSWTIYSLEGTCWLLSKVDEFPPTKFLRILSFSKYLGYFSNENIQKVAGSF